MSSGRCHEQGVTLVELLLYLGAASFIGLVVSRFIVLPTRLTTMMNDSTNIQTGYKATSLPVDDLKCAVSASIRWELIDPSVVPPYDPGIHPSFIPWFQVNDPEVTTGLPLSYVCYYYRATDSALVRTFIPGAGTPPDDENACDPTEAGATEQVVAYKVLAPTAADPLFQKDIAANNMVVVTLRFKGTGTKTTRVVRRVHVRT